MIADFLLTGEANATPAKELCKLIECNSRELTRQIEYERRQGQPICASCNSRNPGYYLAKDKGGMKAYCGKLLHRMGEIAATLRCCKSSIDQLDEQ